MGFPILVKSVRHWFEREYSTYPLDRVAFVCGKTIDQSQLNPYRSRLIVCYLEKGYLHQVLGFINYGSPTLSETFPPYQAPLQSPLDFGVSIDAIREYVNADYPPPNPVIDLMIAATGRYDWHYVDSIPLECLIYAGFTLPPVCSSVELSDYQACFNMGKEEPSQWFETDLSRVPNALARRLPLHRGGKIHLPDSQVWQVLLKPLDRFEGQFLLIKQICEERNQLKRRKFRAHVRVIDSREECESRAPPCVQSIMGQKRFPVDRHRQQLVRIWAKGGVELTLVGKLLDELNDLYPRNDGSVPTQRRWDYVAHYKKGYASPSCEKMDCPLAPGQALDKKKAECFKLFMEKFPDKQPYAKSFYGPVKWYEW